MESSPGLGSRFFFNAVFQRADREEGLESDSRYEPGETGKIIEPISILVAEDDLVSQKLVKKILEMEGHQVTVVENGIQAIERISQENYDCILMDAFMPEMDGIEATVAIRSIEEKKGTYTPIIALTADALLESREKYLSAGMDDYLVKPVKIKSLLQAISKLNDFKK